MLQFDPNLTEDCVNRLLWFCGGSGEMALYFLKTNQSSLPGYYLFYERSNGEVVELEDNGQNGHLKGTDIIGECEICLSPTAVEESGSLSCRHIICLNCACSYIQSQVNQGKTDVKKLLCPCDCSVNYNAFHVLFAGGLEKDNELFDKFISFKVNKVYESSPFVRYCSNKECNKLIIAKARERRVVCKDCGTHSCSTCKKAYHKLPLCRRRDNGATATFRMRLYYLRNGTRGCPNCKFLIEKTKGCDHMTCAKCEYEFCWKCLREYNSEHYSNPLKCTGGGASLEIWGPLYPFKKLYEFIKDVGLVLLVCIGSIIFCPYLVYYNWDEIDDQINEATYNFKRWWNNVKPGETVIEHYVDNRRPTSEVNFNDF